MRTRKAPEKVAVTVYFTEKEVDILERIARSESRSRTEQIRLTVLKAVGLKAKDGDNETGN